MAPWHQLAGNRTMGRILDGQVHTGMK